MGLSCAKEGNVEYYSRLNTRSAIYITDRWPDKILMVNMGGYLPWGEEVSVEDLKHLKELSWHIDYLAKRGQKATEEAKITTLER